MGRPALEVKRYFVVFEPKIYQFLKFLSFLMGTKITLIKVHIGFFARDGFFLCPFFVLYGNAVTVKELNVYYCFRNNDSMLLNVAQIMNLLLGRSLKYKSFKYNYSVLVVKQGQMVKTGRFGTETDKRISAYLDEPLHRPEDGEAFESFKADNEFWRLLIAPVRNFF